MSCHAREACDRRGSAPADLLADERLSSLPVGHPRGRRSPSSGPQPLHERGDPPAPLLRRLGRVNRCEPVDRVDQAIRVTTGPGLAPEGVQDLDDLAVLSSDRGSLHDAIDRVPVPGPELALFRREGRTAGKAAAAGPATVRTLRTTI